MDFLLLVIANLPIVTRDPLQVQEIPFSNTFFVATFCVTLPKKVLNVIVCVWLFFKANLPNLQLSAIEVSKVKSLRPCSCTENHDTQKA